MGIEFNNDFLEKAIKGAVTRRQKRALVRYLSKPNRCGEIIFAAYQNGGLLRAAFFANSDDTAFMLWGKILDMDVDQFDKNNAYQFTIEPSVLKILYYYNRYYERQFWRQRRH